MGFGDATQVEMAEVVIRPGLRLDAGGDPTRVEARRHATQVEVEEVGPLDFKPSTE